MINGGLLILTNSTFSHNQGGGLYNLPDGSLDLRNTILANSVSGVDCYNEGTVTNGANNLIEVNGSEAFACGIPVSTADPLLGPLADNGGLTGTMSFLSGSPAINAGNDVNCPNTDQRGVPRPHGVHCDIGAYEYQDTISPVVNSITRADFDRTSASSVDFNVTFSEAVTGVDKTDFQLTTGGVITPSITAVNGTGVSYAVSVNTGTGNGAIRLDVKNAATGIEDLVGNPLNGGFNSGEVYTIERVPQILIVTKIADTNDGSCNADCSLREAIATAPSGSTIAFDSPLAGQTIRLDSTLTVGNDLTIDASSLASHLAISGDSNNDGIGNVRVLYIENGSNVVLDGLTIEKGKAISGNGNITGASHGGGIYNLGALTIRNGTFASNTAQAYGGAIYNAGAISISHSTFNHNSAVRGGSVACEFGGYPLEISDSTFLLNNAFDDPELGPDGYGGAIYTTCNSRIENSTFSANSASLGGAILSDTDLGLTLEVSNSTFYGNIAPTGGGIANFGQLTVNNSTFAGNISSVKGGAIRNGLGGFLYIKK